MRDIIDRLDEINQIHSADEYDDVDHQYEADTAMETRIKLFCEKEVGWEFDTSYPVVISEGEITLKPAGEEVTLEALEKLKALGTHIKVSAANGYQIIVTMLLHQGLAVEEG